MSDQEWPSELDAAVASAKHHRVILENEHVRVLETIIEAGETTSLHTHRWPAVTYFKSCSEMVRRDDVGNVLMDTRGGNVSDLVGKSVWTPSLGPHTLENVGSGQISVVTVEVKGAR